MLTPSILRVRIGGRSVAPALEHLVVALPLAHAGQAAGRHARCQLCARVVHQHEAREVTGGHPDELPGDGALELHVRHVSGGLFGPAQSTRAPRPARAKFRQRRDADAGPQLVAERDAVHLAAVLVVAHVQRHGGGVHMVEVVEAVPGVAPPGGDVLQIPQARRPQQLPAHLLPVAAQLSLGERSRAAPRGLHACQRSARVAREHVIGSASAGATASSARRRRSHGGFADGGATGRIRVGAGI
mmetsp:Transcript_32997/g.81196  ORF Transcript_32997/g.81196 Transcript_32997/m.81196 type:complete len:243 (+) Transcript_32997:132-860(+)